MKLIIRLPSGDALLLSIGSMSPVRELKVLISQAASVSPRQQILIFDGRVLSDSKVLDQYGLRHGSMIYLSVAPDLAAAPQRAQWSLYGMNASEIIGRLKGSDKMDPRLLFFLNDIQAIEESPDFCPTRDGMKIRDKERDCKFNIIESKPRGLLSMMRFHRAMKAFFEVAESTMSPQFGGPKTVIPQKADFPSEDPLPFFDFCGK